MLSFDESGEDIERDCTAVVRPAGERGSISQSIEQ